MRVTRAVPRVLQRWRPLAHRVRKHIGPQARSRVASIHDDFLPTASASLPQLAGGHAGQEADYRRPICQVVRRSEDGGRHPLPARPERWKAR